MAANRRTILLASALGATALVVALVYTSGGSGASGSPSAPPRRPAQAAATAQADAGAAADVGRVNLELLTAPRTEPVDAGRNPFRFQQRAPAPPPPSTSTAPPPRPAPPRPANETPVFTPPPMPTGPPPPPPIPLKFIGIVTQGNKRLAVLTDGKSAPQSGEEGAIILGQYQILKIGNESIEMAYFDGRGRTTIRLTGQ